MPMQRNGSLSTRAALRAAALVVSMLALAACASKETDRVTGAATRPLGDLNLVREEIPAVLRQAQATPIYFQNCIKKAGHSHCPA